MAFCCTSILQGKASIFVPSSSLYSVTNKSNMRVDPKSTLFERQNLLSETKKTEISDPDVHLIKQVGSNKFSFEKELK